MKKLLYNISLLSMVLLVSACSKNENVVFNGEFIQLPANFIGQYQRINDGIGTPAGYTVSLAGPQKSTPVNFTFEVVDSSSTAIADFHYTVESNTGTIPANSTVGDIPITINDDNIQPGEVVTIVVRLTSADVALNENYILGEYTATVLCGESELALAFAYRHYDNVAGEEFTGEDAFRIFDNMSGVYVVDDFSFGLWPDGFMIDPPTGTLQFRENCGTISFTGTDTFGDVWTMTEILESGGPNFTFKWENTYPDFGTVTLTRLDGQDWPILQL